MGNYAEYMTDTNPITAHSCPRVDRELAARGGNDYLPVMRADSFSRTQTL